jgi:hypothetical protein
MHMSNSRSRHASDSAGIIPLVIGGVCSPSLQGRGLYLDQPICRYTPPRVNLMTGQYDSRVAETAAVVRFALREAGIELVDLIRSVESTPSYTPMAKIMGEFAECESALLKFVEEKKETLTTNGAVVSALVLENIRKAARRVKGRAAASGKLKHVVQGLVKQGREMTEDALQRTLLVSHSHLQNEPFSGLDAFDTFYDKHIVPDVLGAAREEFVAEKKAMESNGLDAFLNVIGAFHAYYALFLTGTKLNSHGQEKTVEAWRKAAFPAKPDADTSSTACVDNSAHEKKANAILDNLIWDILLERFELFASIVEHVFTRIAGPGSEAMRSSVDRFVRMGVLSSMVSAFQTKANMELHDIEKKTFTDASGRLIQEIVVIHSGFKDWFPTFLHADWIAELKSVTEDQMDVLFGEEPQTDEAAEALDDNLKRLVAQISADLYEPTPLKEKLPGGSFSVLSLKTSKVRNLSIASTTAALSEEIKRKFHALAPKEDPTSLLVTKKGKSSITHLNLTSERILVREHIIAEMSAKTPLKTGIREIFAAKVLSALYNQEAYFVALFLVIDVKSTGRRELAHKVLHKIGSVFKPAADASDDSLASHLAVSTILDTTLMIETRTTASMSEAQKANAHSHLFLAADATTWKDIFSLSPEIKIANDRALIRAANTNVSKPAAANKKTPRKPAPSNPAAKQTGRPQSAPPQKPKAPHPTPPQQKTQTAGRGRRRP